MSFKFKIGDMVYIDDPRRDEFIVAKPFRVVGRTLEECPGGVQPQYLVRAFDRLNETARVHEFELAAWTEEDSKRYRLHMREDWVTHMSSVQLIEISVMVEKEMRRRSDEAEAAKGGTT